MRETRREKIFAGVYAGGKYIPLLEKEIADCDMVYILKGVPGCGKSTLIKNIGEEAERRGFDTRYVFCSSDADSLDGIIIDNKTAIVDGTSPHIVEPNIPLLDSAYVDMTRTMDAAAINTHAEELRKLYKSKKECMNDFLALIKFSENTVKRLRILSRLTYDKRKVTEFAKAFVKENGVYGESEIYPCMAFGENGYTLFGSENAEITIIDDSRLYAADIIKEIINRAKTGGFAVKAIPSPTDATSVAGAIMDNALIVSSRYTENGDNYIHSGRFASSVPLPPVFSVLMKTEKEIRHDAEKVFSEFRQIHRDIENIYISACDFSETEKITENLKTAVFG